MKETAMVYHIRIRGHLDARWADWFDGWTLTQEPDGTTKMVGQAADQAVLQGQLKKIGDLGLTLIAVELQNS